MTKIFCSKSSLVALIKNTTDIRHVGPRHVCLISFTLRQQIYSVNGDVTNYFRQLLHLAEDIKRKAEIEIFYETTLLH